MALTFKNRIALHYMLATAALVAAVYVVVFVVVRQQVYAELDRTLRFEAAKHLRELSGDAGAVRFRRMEEWQEREHREVQVAPVFIQLTDERGRLLDRSPNLKADQLRFDLARALVPANATLRGRAIRQVQEPIRRAGRTVGYLVAGISSEAAGHVLRSLGTVLLSTFPVVLLVVFGLARGLAGRSIAPIAAITATTGRITRTNLAERIALPPRPDELHTLASAINDLLGRIEQAVAREKQFTADASHELRTPLAVLRGTFEVLLRKPRTAAEYEARIAGTIPEIDRLSRLVDQLLLLARFDGATPGLHRQELSVPGAVHDVLHRHRASLTARQLRVDVTADDLPAIVTDPYLVDLILDNLLSNAIKYSPDHSRIAVALAPAGAQLRCTVRDQGIGISPEALPHIFDPLYRADALAHKHIGGTGLGLSIVARACALLGIGLAVESELGRGTAFTLLFPAR